MTRTVYAIFHREMEAWWVGWFGLQVTATQLKVTSTRRPPLPHRTGSLDMHAVAGEVGGSSRVAVCFHSLRHHFQSLVVPSLWSRQRLGHEEGIFPPKLPILRVPTHLQPSPLVLLPRIGFHTLDTAPATQHPESWLQPASLRGKSLGSLNTSRF